VADGFREVKVVLRSANGHERAWMVEVDPGSPLGDLLPDLVEALPIEGEADNYDLQSAGTLDDPVLILTEKPRRHVGRIRDIGP
jgi:hypothetical protein